MKADFRFSIQHCVNKFIWILTTPSVATDWQIQVIDSQNVGVGMGCRDFVIQPILFPMDELRP